MTPNKLNKRKSKRATGRERKGKIRIGNGKRDNTAEEASQEKKMDALGGERNVLESANVKGNRRGSVVKEGK